MLGGWWWWLQAKVRVKNGGRAQVMPKNQLGRAMLVS